MPSPIMERTAEGSRPPERICSVHWAMPLMVRERYSSGSISTWRGEGYLIVVGLDACATQDPSEECTETLTLCVPASKPR